MVVEQFSTALLGMMLVVVADRILVFSPFGPKWTYWDLIGFFWNWVGTRA